MAVSVAVCGFLMLKLRVVVPPGMMAAGEKLLVSSTGAAVVPVEIVAESPADVPALPVVTDPVAFVYLLLFVVI